MSVRGADLATRARPETQRFQFGPWILTSVKSHILTSEGPARENFESQLELPQVPEMIFADNILKLEHQNGFGVNFNSLDALKLVDAHHDPLKVAVSQAWQEARADSEIIKEVVKPFDWTFTTDYKGTVFGKKGSELKVSPTDERIDIEKLKVREKIIFYDEILLFEDELADNGCSILSVKIRVMPTSFFILMRFFMRVDNVIIRVNDTRLYHEADKPYLLREYSSRDDKVADIKWSSQFFTDPNEMSKRLTLRKETFEKLEFPTTKTNNTDSQTEVGR